MLKLLSIAVVLTLAVGCNRSSTNDNPVQNIQEAVKETSLQEKAFLGDCQAKPINEIATGLLTLGEASVKSQRIQFKFTGANVTRTTRLYAMANCADVEALTFEEFGEFTIHEDQKTSDSGIFVDFNFQKVELVMANQAGVVIANRIGVCNMTNWNINDRRDVTGAANEVTCYNTDVPRQEFNVYRIDNGNTLYFGTKDKSNSPDQRPSAIKADLKYVAN